MVIARHMRGLLLSLLVCLGGASSVQSQDLGVPISPILVVDLDRIFRTSKIGVQITFELEQQLEALAAENRKIEQELETEETDLTTRRAELGAEEFRALADEFDQKVQAFRAEQDTKQRELQRLTDAESSSFRERIAPILSAIGRERGAVAVMERRYVLLSADGIDITNEAITRINAAAEQNKSDVVNQTVTPSEN